VAAAVCTIGPELEKLASAQEDLVLALALDGLGNAAVETIAQQVCQRLGEQAQTAGLEAGTPLSPGEPDWPVEVGQPQVFTLVNAEAAGVRLTEGGMMVPKKSVSFVLGIGQNMDKTDACELCSMNERCRYRHA
jgi:cobalamin-dependent methionine synthase I